MARKPNLIPSVQLNVALPIDLQSKLTLHLYSDLEQRVPHGAFSRFIIERLREYFSNEHLDLAVLLDTAPGVLLIQGTPEAIAALKRNLP